MVVKAGHSLCLALPHQDSTSRAKHYRQPNCLQSLTLHHLLIFPSMLLDVARCSTQQSPMTKISPQHKPQHCSSRCHTAPITSLLISSPRQQAVDKPRSGMKKLKPKQGTPSAGSAASSPRPV